MKYTVATATSIEELIKNVELELKAGWEPIGSVSCTVAPSGKHVVFMQAVIKRATKNA